VENLEFRIFRRLAPPVSCILCTAFVILRRSRRISAFEPGIAKSQFPKKPAFCVPKSCFFAFFVKILKIFYFFQFYQQHIASEIRSIIERKGRKCGVLDMYGCVSDGNNEMTNDIILDKGEEFEQLVSEYPEHEIYLFLGTEVDMALFFAPGVSAMLIETRASPEKMY